MLKKILQMTQKQLKSFSAAELRKYYKKVDNRKKFIYCKGELPVLLVAHLDTVHKDIPKDIFHDKEQDVMWSPQGIGGDDRCGIYAIFSLLERGLRPHVLFTCDEEIGGVGASEFSKSGIPLDDVKYLIELDRRGEKDMVFYECGNEEFINYVETFGFEEDYGSFSDICYISPVYDLASVNLSIGYYNEHRTEEFIKVKHMEATINKVEAMLRDSITLEEPFDYQEVIFTGGFSYGKGTSYSPKSGFDSWWKECGYSSEDEFWEEEYGYSRR